MRRARVQARRNTYEEKQLIACVQHVDPHEKRHLEQRRMRTNAASIKLLVDDVPKVGGGGGGKLVLIDGIMEYIFLKTY